MNCSLIPLCTTSLLHLTFTSAIASDVDFQVSQVHLHSLLLCLCVSTEQVLQFAEPHSVKLPKDLHCLCRIRGMARFPSEADLAAFLGRLDQGHAQYAAALWRTGLRTSRQL